MTAPELVAWATSLPSRDAITPEAIGAELRRRFDLVPGTVRGDELVQVATDALMGTYDEFRAEARR